MDVLRRSCDDAYSLHRVRLDVERMTYQEENVTRVSGRNEVTAATIGNDFEESDFGPRKTRTEGSHPLEPPHETSHPRRSRNDSTHQARGSLDNYRVKLLTPRVEPV